jgi:hypothetical protein
MSFCLLVYNQTSNFSVQSTSDSWTFELVDRHRQGPNPGRPRRNSSMLPQTQKMRTSWASYIPNPVTLENKCRRFFKGVSWSLICRSFYIYLKQLSCTLHSHIQPFTSQICLFVCLFWVARAIFIRPSIDGTYYGTAMSVRPSVRSGFSTNNFIFLLHIKVKFIL